MIMWLRECDKCTQFFHTMDKSFFDLALIWSFTLTNPRSAQALGKQTQWLNLTEEGTPLTLLIDSTISTNRSEINEHNVQFYKSCLPSC